MNPHFFERLYRGYAGEHHISGQLFERSFEVFRLPADFGLDLVVTNQFRASQGLTADATNFPFALQVKSRWVRPDEITLSANQRPQAEITFGLKRDEVSLLVEHGNSAIAFVFYWPVNAPTFYLPRFFMIHSREIQRLVNAGYFRLADSGYLFSVRYRELPLTYRDQLVNELWTGGHISPDGANRLAAELPETFNKNWNAQPYLQFARDPRTQDWNQLVWRTPAYIHMDFSTFPHFEPLHGLD